MKAQARYRSTGGTATVLAPEHCSRAYVFGVAGLRQQQRGNAVTENVLRRGSWRACSVTGWLKMRSGRCLVAQRIVKASGYCLRRGYMSSAPGAAAWCGISAWTKALTSKGGAIPAERRGIGALRIATARSSSLMTRVVLRTAQGPEERCASVPRRCRSLAGSGYMTERSEGGPGERDCGAFILRGKHARAWRPDCSNRTAI